MVFPTSYCTSAPGYSLQTIQYTAVIVFHIVHFVLDLDSLQCTAYISDQLQCTGTSIFITQYAIHCCHSVPLCAIQLHPPWYFALIGRLCRVYLILDNSSFQQFAGAKVHCIFSKWNIPIQTELDRNQYLTCFPLALRGLLHLFQIFSECS